MQVLPDLALGTDPCPWVLCSRNSISILPATLFRLPSVRVLKLGWNRLEVLEDTISNAKSLVELVIGVPLCGCPALPY